jgi:hypothetical protein
VRIVGLLFAGVRLRWKVLPPPCFSIMSGRTRRFFELVFALLMMKIKREINDFSPREVEFFKEKTCKHYEATVLKRVKNCVKTCNFLVLIEASCIVMFCNTFCLHSKRSTSSSNLDYLIKFQRSMYGVCIWHFEIADVLWRR